MKLMQSTAFEQKRFDLRSLSPALSYLIFKLNMATKWIIMRDLLIDGKKDSNYYMTLRCNYKAVSVILASSQTL